MMTGDFQTDLDTLLQAVRRTVSKEIDAGCCRTEYDWKQAHKAKDNEQEIYDAFVARYGKAG